MSTAGFDTGPCTIRFEVFFEYPPGFDSERLVLEGRERTEMNGRREMLETSKRAA